MRLIIDSFKKAVSIFWDDSIMLLVFNVLIFLSIFPAFIFLNLFSTESSVLTSIVSTLLFFPIVFFLFPLFSIVYDLAQGKVAKFKTYFQYMRQTAKQALIWGGINLLAFLLFSWNMRFYAQFIELWAAALQLLFLSIMFIWLVLQLVMLPIYPRLVDPHYKLALRNAMGILGRYSFSILALVILIVLLLALTVFFQVVGVFFTFVLVAVLLEGFVGSAVQNETEKEDSQEDVGA